MPWCSKSRINRGALESYKDFFEAQPGFKWAHDPAEFSYSSLVRIMLNLNTSAPEKMLETLYFAEFFADKDFFDNLLHIADRNGISVPHNMTPPDLAILLCLECRHEIEHYHAVIHKRGTPNRPKRFESYFVKDVILPMRTNLEGVLEAMQADLDEWAEDNKRGIGMRVFVIDEGDAVWFMIRHGQPMKRQNTVEEDGSDGMAFFRPEKYDAMIYYPATGELASGVKTKKERLAYAQAIGHHFFHNATYFNVASCGKYTLQPLIDDGADALACGFDDSGVVEAKLIELHIARNHKEIRMEILRGDDIFAALELLNRSLVTDIPITLEKAKFKLKLNDGRVLPVIVKVPNVGNFDHTGDHPIIHKWLESKGFVTREYQTSTEKEVNYAEQI
ncbi:MAG: hypothetical protein ACRC2T_10160 [Thermoguttaceae bacterium]